MMEERVVALLKEAKMTLAAAESCTGGLLSKRITDVSGASAVFPGGAVTYAVEAKIRMLGVDAELLAEKGAVCPEVARQMAYGVRRLLGTDIGIGITGLAGPNGDGSSAKVGDVYIGFAAPEGAYVMELHDPIGRDAVRALACDRALEIVCTYLQNRESFFPNM